MSIKLEAENPTPSEIEEDAEITASTEAAEEEETSKDFPGAHYVADSTGMNRREHFKNAPKPKSERQLLIEKMRALDERLTNVLGKLNGAAERIKEVQAKDAEKEASELSSSETLKSRLRKSKSHRELRKKSRSRRHLNREYQSQRHLQGDERKGSRHFSVRSSKMPRLKELI